MTEFDDDMFGGDDGGQDRIAEGERLKAEGIGRADRCADSAWKEAAYAAVVEVAGRMPNFTADDVFEVIERSGAVTHENRAFGAVMLRTARNGVCCKTRSFPETRASNRPELHRGREQIWDSLLYCDDTDFLAE